MANAGEIPATGVRGAKSPWELLIAAHGSFCAHAVRAIKIFKAALERFDLPVCVRREIVRSRHVIEGLERRRAAFEKRIEGKGD